jgi:hypothetical protein
MGETKGEIVNLRRAPKRKRAPRHPRKRSLTGRNSAASAPGATPPIKRAYWKKSASRRIGVRPLQATIRPIRAKPPPAQRPPLILSGRKPEVSLRAERFAKRTQWKRATGELSRRTSNPRALQDARAPSCRAFPADQSNSRPGHTYPFIARLTRAYLNFEVKDAPKAGGLRRSRSLSSKFRYAFLPPSDEWVLLRGELVLKPYDPSSLICSSNQVRSCFHTALSGESNIKRAMIDWPCRK